MKTRACPFCGKEISDEAIICKFCHKLLIDENGNDIEAADTEEAAEEIVEETVQAAEEAEVPESEDYEIDDKTIVYSKDELFSRAAEDDAEISTDDLEFDDSDAEEEYEEEYSDEEYSDEEYEEEYEEEEYEEEYEEEQAPASIDEYDAKRTFIITAIITIGILIIIIAAVNVGYKLFGVSDESSSSAAPLNPSASQTQNNGEAKPSDDDNTPAVTDDSVSDEYVPAVTDDTVSLAPSDIADSTIADPVTDSASSDESAADDSSADTSSSDDTSSDDSTADSQDEGGDTTGKADGSYYTWDEAMSIMDAYASSNGGTYSYSYGTDGVEMVFDYYDADGNYSNVRVDLVTGAASAM